MTTKTQRTRRVSVRPRIDSMFFETEGVATCVVCGCTDLHACPGGCSWREVDRERGVGVCSRCPLPRPRRKKAKK